VVVVIMRWIGSKYDTPAGRLEASWVRRTSIDASCRLAGALAIYQQSKFALVATGVATAKIATHVETHDRIKF
jgi:hypothetical protein